MPLQIYSSIEQFADVTKVYRVIKCSKDATKLQKDLDTVMT